MFKSETTLLEKHGNEVLRFTVSNDSFDTANVFNKVRMTLGMAWSFKYYRSVNSLIKDNRPDIVHVHTFFPLLSPSVLYAARKNGIPVVATLHDTRFVCPCATSLRAGTLCNECGDGHYVRMIKHHCFKGSIFQSIIVASIFKYHRLRGTFYNIIDKYICLNDNQIQLLEDIGFASQKIIKKYNFVPEPCEKKESLDIDVVLPNRYVVFFGRIGEEKGIRILMKAWDKISDIPLVIMGDGPLYEELEDWAKYKKNVFVLGYIQHDKCIEIVKQSDFVVFPSIWYEGCSMVEIETESLCKPLIASDLGFSSEAIVDGYNGLKFVCGDENDFAEKVVSLWNNPTLCREMGENARKDYEMKYMEDDNYKQLMNIYEMVL